MIKVITLIRRPADPEGFDRHYFDVHLPLLRTVPGLERVEIARVAGSAIGDEGYHLVAETFYASREAMDAANASPEGKAAARDLLTIAPAPLIVFGEIQ